MRRTGSCAPRTIRPSVTSRPRGSCLESFDARYDTADDLDAVYEEIAEALITAAATHGEVVYAVPGSPTVAERSVELLVRGRA